MSIMRDEHQACLAGLGSYGSELVERYRDLLDSADLSNEICVVLQNVLAERNGMIERLAAMQRARGELPKAGDPELVFLHSIGDWAREQVLGDTGGTVRRLREADKAWLESIEEALELKWNGSEQRALEALREHVVWTIARLEALSGD